MPKTSSVSDFDSNETKGPVRRSVASLGRNLRDDVQEFKRDRILSAAIDIFFDKGFQSTTVDEIAAAMSVTKAVVYWNFKSKMELLDEIVDRALAKLSLCMQCIDHDRAAAKNLAEFCFIHSSTILSNQKEVAVYLFERRHVSDPLKQKIMSQRDLLVGALADVLKAGVGEDVFRLKDHELVAYDIVSMSAMTFDWRWHQRVERHSPQSLAVHFAEQALRLAGFSGDFPFADGDLAITPASGL